VTLGDQLSRFEAMLAELFPGLLARFDPGLDDAGIERMRAALAPLKLPPEVETMYRWRDGGPAVFAGWRLLPVDRVVRDRGVLAGALGEPPAWLRIFGDQVVAFVEAGVPGTERDASLWYGHTHDVELYRIADSLEAFVASCGYALEAGALVESRKGLRFPDGDEVTGAPFTPYRLERSPGVHAFGAHPSSALPSSAHPSSAHPSSTGASAPSTAGAVDRRMRLPDPDWPAPWLVSLGMDAGRIAPRGRSHSIMELDGSPEGAVATLLGTVRVLGAVGHTLNVVFADETYELRLDIDTDVTVFAPDSGGGLNEIDISLGTAPEAASGVEVLAVRPLGRVADSSVGEDGA